VALAQGDVSTAERSLLGIVEGGADGYSLRMLLARGAFERGSMQVALQHAQAAVRFDAERPDAHRLLLELAAKIGDDTLALQALRALAELDQHDAAIHIAYLSLLARNKAWDEVIREGETALFIAPEEPSVHLHLGQGYVERGAHARGLVELDRALALGYAKPGSVRVVRAKALLGLGKRAAAMRELRLSSTTEAEEAPASPQ
jgi:Tfp pilus assembly protein PilF